MGIIRKKNKNKTKQNQVPDKSKCKLCFIVFLVFLKLCLRFSRRKDKVEKAGILVLYFGGHFEGLEGKRLVNNVL